jgi:hypothetical protein
MSSRIAISTPMAFAMTSQKRLCQAALATARVSRRRPATHRAYACSWIFPSCISTSDRSAAARLRSCVAIRRVTPSRPRGRAKGRRPSCWFARPVSLSAHPPAGSSAGSSGRGRARCAGALRRRVSECGGRADGEPGALRRAPEGALRGAAVDARGNRRDEAILRKRQIGNQVVELKDKADLVPQKRRRLLCRLTSTPLTATSSAIGPIQSGEQSAEGAFAAARRPAECHGFALEAFNIHALENRDGPVVVALPQPLRAQRRCAVCYRLQRPVSFESQRLHRTDPHGVDCRIERARNAGKQS